MTILESIPMSIYSLVIGVGVSAVVWITLRLFRPYPAGLTPEELDEVQELEAKLDVIIVAFHKRKFSEDSPGPVSFFDG